RIEEAIDVRRAHAQLLGDVGHRGLLVPDLAKEALRGRQDPPADVGFDLVGHVIHRAEKPSVHLAAVASGVGTGWFASSDAVDASPLAPPCCLRLRRYHSA